MDFVSGKSGVLLSCIIRTPSPIKFWSPGHVVLLGAQITWSTGWDSSSYISWSSSKYISIFRLCMIVLSIFTEQTFLFVFALNMSTVLRTWSWWFSPCQWRAEKGWLMMYYALLPHMLARSWCQTAGHKMIAPIAVLLQLSNVSFFNRQDHKLT